MPEGRAANQPLAATTFKPPIGSLLPGARVSLAVIGSPARFGVLDRLGRELLQARLLLGRGGGVNARVIRRPEFRDERLEVLARVLAGARGDLRRQQVHDEAVLVGRPDGAVAPQEARPGALLPAEAEGAVEQTRARNT